MRETYFSSDDGLLTMGLATRGPGFCVEDVVRAEWSLARDLGIPITVHVAMGRVAGRFGMIKQLNDYGLLGPDTTYIHCCYFSEEEWQLVADSGGTISIAPQVEVQMGHGWPPVMKAIEYGLPPSLSIDVVTTAPGDMFTEMRSAFGTERARVNAECWQADTPVPDTMLTAPDARDGGHQRRHRGGTPVIAPDRCAWQAGRRRLIHARALNVAPVIDPVAAVTLCADVSNVETVMVDGQFRKRDGQAARRRRQGQDARGGVSRLLARRDREAQAAAT